MTRRFYSVVGSQTVISDRHVLSNMNALRSRIAVLQTTVIHDYEAKNGEIVAWRADANATTYWADYMENSIDFDDEHSMDYWLHCMLNEDNLRAHIQELLIDLENISNPVMYNAILDSIDYEKLVYMTMSCIEVPKDYDIETTIVSGSACKKCHETLPDMTMAQHINGDFKHDCPAEPGKQLNDLMKKFAECMIAEQEQLKNTPCYGYETLSK